MKVLDQLSADDIVAEISMTRTAFRGTILLVESDNDARVYERFTTKGQCVVLATSGKEKALDAMEIVHRRMLVGVVAILDADFSRVLPAGSSFRDILLTDWHDIEIMMIESPACDSVIRELGSREKTQQFLREKGEASIEKILYGIICPLSTLRLVSAREGLNLCFKGLAYERFIDKNTLELSIEKLIMTVIDNSARPRSLANWLLAELNRTIERERADLRELSCGHDVTALMSIGFRKVFGTRNRSLVQREAIEQSLRLAYEFSYFRSTKLYGLGLSWVRSNSEFNLFKVA